MIRSITTRASVCLALICSIACALATVATSAYAMPVDPGDRVENAAGPPLVVTTTMGHPLWHLIVAGALGVAVALIAVFVGHVVRQPRSHLLPAH